MSLKAPTTSKQKSKWSILFLKKKKVSLKLGQHARVIIWWAPTDVPAYPSPGLPSDTWHGCLWCLGLLLVPPTCPAPWMGQWGGPGSRSCPATLRGDPDTPDTHQPLVPALTFSNSSLSYFCVLEKHVVDFPVSIWISASFWSSFGDLYLIRP